MKTKEYDVIFYLIEITIAGVCEGSFPFLLPD